MRLARSAATTTNRKLIIKMKAGEAARPDEGGRPRAALCKVLCRLLPAAAQVCYRDAARRSAPPRPPSFCRGAALHCPGREFWPKRSSGETPRCFHSFYPLLLFLCLLFLIMTPAPSPSVSAEPRQAPTAVRPRHHAHALRTHDGEPSLNLARQSAVQILP